MAQKPFGRVLAESREAHGMDIAYAAQQLRIRADILRAIEQNDFARMPARGYTRNMVGAYARFLGLNAAAITRQYLEEANDYQVSLRQYDSRSPRSSRGQARAESSPRASGAARRPDRNARGRDVYSDREERVPRSSGRGVSYQQQPSSMRSTRSRRSGGYGSMPAQSAGNPILERLPMIVAAVVAIVLVVFLITQIVGCVAPKSSDDMTSVPITGVSDTTGGESTSNTSTAAVVETPPTSVSVSYTIPSGEEVYLEVYENDSSTASVAEVATGPTTAAYTVTNKLKIVTVNPDAIEITVDGQVVEMTANDDGLYEYTVDFAAVLNQWAQTHKATTAASTTSNTTANATPNSNATSNTNTTANANANANASA